MVQQGIRNKKNKAASIKAKKKSVRKRHKEYGTSKLEKDFAHDFLDKLGLKYVYQYEAKPIKRFYDFAVIYDDGNDFSYTVRDGLKTIDETKQFCRIEALIEVDGDWYHSNSRIVNEANMNPMQKHNKRIDEYKNKFALLNNIVLLRFWEYDIRNNPSKVMDELKARLTVSNEKIKKKEERKKKPIKNNNKKIEENA